MNCPNCGAEMKLVPAGVSKTSGKQYPSFFSCPNCKETVNPPIHQPPKPAPAQEKPKTNGVSTDMMRLAYRKDLMVALINTNRVQFNEEFRDLWGEIESG